MNNATNNETKVPRSTRRLNAQPSSVAIPEPGRVFRPVPDSAVTAGNSGRPVWRIWLSPINDPDAGFGLDVNGDCILGRESQESSQVDLSTLGAERLGMSRQHAMLRPTLERLYLIDLNSTNGTRKNGQRINPAVPSQLLDSDLISLGGLNLSIRIVQPPTDHLRALAELARAQGDYQPIFDILVGQLDTRTVITEALTIVLGACQADEAAIWLLDEESGALRETGVELKGANTGPRRLQIPDVLLKQALDSTTPVHLINSPKEPLQTTYGVEDFALIQLSSGGMPLGVMAVASHVVGRRLNDHDVEVLQRLGGTVAVALQNARRYAAVHNTMTARLRDLDFLNVLASDIASTLDQRQICRLAADHLMRHWKATCIGLWVVDGQELVNQIDAKNPVSGDCGFPERVPLQRGAIGGAAAYREAILLSKLSNHMLYDPAIDHSDAAVMGLPILYDQHLLGYVLLGRKSEDAFSDLELDNLNRTTYPLASALRNAQLHKESEAKRLTVQMMTDMLSEPLFILDSEGNLLISNQNAASLLQNHLGPLMNGISEAAGSTAEVTLDNRTYLMAVRHSTQLGTIVLMQDISYVKRLEKSRARLLRGLSHDLKSPIASIRGIADLLARMYELDEEGEELRKQIMDGTDKMLVMIQEMISVAYSVEMPRLSRKPQDLDAVLRQAIQDLEGAARSRSIEIEYRISGAPYLVYMDERAIYRVFLNLLDNALRYGPPNSVVHVTTTYDSEEVRTAVLDEGKGIADEDIPHLFSPFFRGRNATLSSDGYGIGLEFVYNTVTSHGGHVSVSNVSGHGAEFLVTLPREKPEG